MHTFARAGKPNEPICIRLRTEFLSLAAKKATYIKQMMVERKTEAPSWQGNGGLWIWILMGIAAALRVAYLIHYSELPEWSMLTVDNYYHHHWALDMASGNLIGDTTYFRAPLYVWCLGLLYAVAGASLWTGRIFGVIVGLVSIFLTYRIGFRLFDRRTGILAAALHAVYPLAVYFETELLLDPLFTLLLELAVYRMIVWWQEPSGRNIAFCGLALGLACLTRPTGLLLLPVLLALPLLRFEMRDRWRTALLGVASCLIVIAPVTARNLAVAGDSTLIAAQGGINFYLGNNEAADGLAAVMPEPFGYNWQLSDMSGLAQQAEDDRTLKPGQISRYWYLQGWGWIKDNPATALRLYLRKLYFFFSSDEISNNRDLPRFFAALGLRGVLYPVFGFIFAFSVLGLVIHWRPQKLVRLLLAAILLISIVSAAFFFSSRFRIPMLPFFFVLAASGALGIGHWKAGRRTAVLPGILAALLAGILSYGSLYSLPPANPSQALLAEGRFYYHQGDLSAAKAAMTEALSHDPAFPEASTALGTVFLRAGQTDSARVYLEREVQRNPNNMTGLNNLLALHLVTGEADASSEALNERARQVRPWDKTAQQLRLRLAWALSKPVEELQQDIAQAASATNDHVDVLNEGAVILSQLGHVYEAERLARRAILSEAPPIEMNASAFGRLFEDSPENWRRRQARSHYLLAYFKGLAGDFQESIDESRIAIRRDPALIEAWLNLYNGYQAAGDQRSADSVMNLAIDRFGKQRVESLMPPRP